MKMPFRDDLSALETRRASLERELAGIRERKRELAELDEREKQLERELQEAAAVLGSMPGANPPPAASLLDNVRVASPCDASWDEMEGNGRVRYCLRCEKNVYNVSGMPREEAEELLRSRGELCVRLYRRTDDTVLTTDCPVGVEARRSKNRRLALAAIGGSLIATGAGAFAAAEGNAGACRRMGGTGYPAMEQGFEYLTPDDFPSIEEGVVVGRLAGSTAPSDDVLDSTKLSNASPSSHSAQTSSSSQTSNASSSSSSSQTSNASSSSNAAPTSPKAQTSPVWKEPLRERYRGRIIK
ncbi:hypothetical protein [Pendulispora albinea]|uniref:Uncharacterized protein n=1 Tax=Pendulispora albinea TaxID=2741071 RepID=A0ABZ2LK23_9BACT